jgi:ligand-binding sensor domain-containing protein
MATNFKLWGIALIAAAGAVAGAYTLGKRSGVSAVQDAAKTVAAPAPVGKGTMPANHPAMPAAGGDAERQGKVKVDGTQAFTHFRVGNKNVKAIHADGKVMWVGTSGGVIRYDTTNDEFKLFDAKNGLLSNGIFHISKLQGRIAVGTYGGGLSLYDEKANQWETFNIPDGLGDAFVYDVLQATNGDVWIATWSGANRIRGGALKDRSKWDLYTVENTKGGLPNDWVYGLAEGKNGDVWLATEGGMARFAGNRWENWNHAKGVGAPYELVKNDIQFKNDPSKLSVHHAKQKEEMGLQKVDVAYNPNYIVSLRVDGEGTVWAGTWGGGLARYDGRQWKNYTVADGLPGNHVFMLHLDHNRQLWIGTNKGLARLKDGKFQVMTTEHGLFAENVFSMASTPEGALWVGSYGGVANIRKASLN